MSIAPITNVLNQLEKMHKSLLELSRRKTAVIKVGDMERLDQLLKDEQAHVAALTTLEQQRVALVTDYLQTKGIVYANTPTVADVIEAADSLDDQQQLSEIRDRLFALVDELKTQNELNQKLVYQSLQFVNMTLDLLRPQPTDSSMNYSKNEVRQSTDNPSKSYFNSEA